MRGSAFADAAALFDALGDPNRLSIFTSLCDGGPCTTSQVTTAISVSRQGVTKHLSILEAVGLVHCRKQGRQRIWTVQTRPLGQAGDYLAQLSDRWDRRIDRLKAFVEDS